MVLETVSWATVSGGGGSSDGDAWGVTGEDITSAVTRTGSVGIGVTPASQAKLHVSGNVLSGVSPSITGTFSGIAVLGGTGNNAGSHYSGILGGSNDTVTGNYSAVVGGLRNSLSSGATATVIAGGADNKGFNGGNSFLAGGTRNLNYNVASAIIVGQDNRIESGTSTSNSGIYSGANDTIDGSYTSSASILGARNSRIGGGGGNASVISGGNTNKIVNSHNAFVGGGSDNYVNITNSTAVAGTGNALYSGTSSTANGIFAGYYDTIKGAYHQGSVILGGTKNVLDGSAGQSAIVGGESNLINSAAVESAIVGGTNNLVSLRQSSIIGGQDNTITSGTSSGNCGILAGTGNTINASYINGSTILGGENNTVNQADLAVVLGGHDATAHVFAEIVGGRFNTSSGSTRTYWSAAASLFKLGNGSDASTLNDAFIVYKNGNATLDGTLTQSSDRRLKKDITPLENSLEKLLKLNGYSYNWKDTIIRSSDKQIGVIAQEVQAEFPDLVKQVADNKIAVNYSGLIPVLIEATKEQQSQIEALKATNAKQAEELENYKNLEAKLDALIEQLGMHESAKK